jgi:hypothetical protein
MNMGGCIRVGQNVSAGPTVTNAVSFEIHRLYNIYLHFLKYMTNLGHNFNPKFNAHLCWLSKIQ